MRQFYEEYFELIPSELYHNEDTGFRSYFMQFPKGPQLELMNQESMAGTVAEGIPFGLAHMAFSLGSEDAVDKKTHQLEMAGFTRIGGPRITGDGYYESVVLDLEGNRLELTV